MIVIVAALDTKGDKVEYLKNLICSKGEWVLVIDVGVIGSPPFKADISKEEVAKAAGYSIAEISALDNEAEAMKIMAQGASGIVRELYEKGELEAIIGVGGTMAASFFARVSKALPLGVPKVLLSTCLFSPFFPRHAISDLITVPLISDIWGLSDLAKKSIEYAAGTIVGVVQFSRASERIQKKKFVALTTLGTSVLQYVRWIRPQLQSEGKEVAVFHIGGGQGKQYEEFVREGMIEATFDMCLLDLCPYFLKDTRFLNTPERLESAGKNGIPQIIAPGASLLLGFGGSPEELPEEFRSRKLRPHNELALEVERSDEEVEMTARLLAEKIERSNGPVIILFPVRGFYGQDSPGKVFHSPRKRSIFIETFKKCVGSETKCIELDAHINDHAFAEEAIKAYHLIAKS